MIGTALAIGGAAALGAGSSLFNAHSQASSARKLTKLNYEYGQRSLIASPTHYKEGLEMAGINPILASNFPIGATQGSTGISPNMDLAGDVSKGVSAKMLADQTKSQIDLNKSASTKNTSESQAQLMNAQSNQIQAQAAMKNAETNEKMLTISGTNAGANVAGALGGLAKDGALVYTAVKNGKVPAAGASAKAVKGAKNVVVPTPTSAGAVSKSAKVLPAIGAALSPAIVPAALTTAVGAGALMKTAQDTAKKNNTKSYQKYRSFTHHMSAGW